MKKKDIGVIALVAVLSGMFSIIISSFVFSKPEDRNQKAEVVEVLKAEFISPDSAYFNSQAFNPSQDIEVGADPNSNPFDGN
jgi:hypothetical protein